MSNEIKDIIREEIRALIKAEVRAMFQPPTQPATAPPVTEDPPRVINQATDTSQLRSRKAYYMMYPRNTVVRINQTSPGPQIAHNTVHWKIWLTAKEHLGMREIGRTQLTRDLEVLLNRKPMTLSAPVTLLLKEGCLLVVTDK